jgi:hypothetical protein
VQGPGCREEGQALTRRPAAAGIARGHRGIQAFDRAVEEIAASARLLIASLVTAAEPKDRDVEAARARARSAERFGASR